MINFCPKIVYEDSELLIIDKPAGMIVNRSETVKERTVQDWVEENFKIKEGNKNTDFFLRSGIVHRLDKETSGLLIVAKDEESFLNLQKKFKEKEIEKRYYALVHGLVSPLSGEIKAPVSRNPFNRERFGVFLGGKEAITAYRLSAYFKKIEMGIFGDKKTLKSFKKNSSQKRNEKVFSLVEVFPKTGRTHQIRVHFKYIGHPLVADDFYAGRKISRDDRKWCPRLFLHAFYLRFYHPVDNKEIIVKTDIPPDLKSVLDNFLVKL